LITLSEKLLLLSSSLTELPNSSKNTDSLKGLIPKVLIAASRKTLPSVLKIIQPVLEQIVKDLDSSEESANILMIIQDIIQLARHFSAGQSFILEVCPPGPASSN
jgi:hypothetical protein